MTSTEWSNYVKDAIEECITENKWSVNTMAKVKGIAPQTIYNWVRGKNVPQVETFLKAFPEYNFEGINECVFETRGTKTKNTHHLPEPKKVKKPVVEEPIMNEPVEEIYISELCKKCVHCKICKYSEEYSKIEAKLANDYSAIKTGMLIAHAYLICDEFSDSNGLPAQYNESLMTRF